MTNSPDRYGNLWSDQHYGVFDLRNRTFVVNPKTLDVSELFKIDDKSFKLINPEGRYFATLYLPGEYRGRFYPDVHVEPQFANGEKPVEEFIGKAQNPDLDIDNQYWKAMRRKNPHAYRLLVVMLELGGEESSPINDLNYARALREIINGDVYYRGNIDRALDEVAKLSEIMTDSGSQTDINTWTDCLRLISSIRTSLAYDSLISGMPDNELIKKEYVAWHNLIEAMAYYLDYLYSSETYKAVPEEKNTTIIGWLDQRRAGIGKEHDILSGSRVYSLDPSKNDSVRTESDFRDFFLNFHSYADPNYYHPMWNEIKAAFDEWRFIREKIAEELDPHRSLSYHEYTKEVVDSVFNCIEGLDSPAFRPALC